MGKPFERIHACIAGKMENAERIPIWVRANGGSYHKNVTRKVTHLIVSEATYQENGEAGMLEHYGLWQKTNLKFEFSANGQSHRNSQDCVL